MTADDGLQAVSAIGMFPRLHCLEHVSQIALFNGWQGPVVYPLFISSKFIHLSQILVMLVLLIVFLSGVALNSLGRNARMLLCAWLFINKSESMTCCGKYNMPVKGEEVYWDIQSLRRKWAQSTLSAGICSSRHFINHLRIAVFPRCREQVLIGDDDTREFRIFRSQRVFSVIWSWCNPAEAPIIGWCKNQLSLRIKVRGWNKNRKGHRNKATVRKPRMSFMLPRVTAYLLIGEAEEFTNSKRRGSWLISVNNLDWS